MIAMTNLSNQLRAAAYLASRDAYVKGAFVLPILAMVMLALMVLLSGGYAWVAFDTSLTGCLSVGTVFGTSFAMLGLVSHDRESHGMRASVATECGRAGYVVSRVVLSGVLAASLALWSVVCSLLALALPGTIVVGMSPGVLALLVLTRFLVGWAYALICISLIGQAHSMGANFFAALFVTGGVISYAVLMACSIFWTVVLRAALPEAVSNFIALMSMSDITSVMPEVLTPRLVLLPLFYLVVAGALLFARTARRSL